MSVGTAIIYNIPKFFELETVEVVYFNATYDENPMTTGASFINGSHGIENDNGVDVVRNETTVVEDLGYRGTPMRLNHWYYVLYVFWSKFLIVELVPWLTLIILNC